MLATKDCGGIKTPPKKQDDIYFPSFTKNRGEREKNTFSRFQ